MILRIATLNLEQDHKCWAARRELIAAQLRDINPDLWALNEIHIPSQTGRWLQKAASKATGTKYALLQQSKAGEESRTQGEALLTRYPVIETAKTGSSTSTSRILLPRRWKIRRANTR